MSTLMLCAIIYLIGCWCVSFIGSYTNQLTDSDDWLIVVGWPLIAVVGTVVGLMVWPSMLGDYMRERAQKKRLEKVQRERAEKEASRTEATKTN